MPGEIRLGDFCDCTSIEIESRLLCLDLLEPNDRLSGGDLAEDFARLVDALRLARDLSRSISDRVWAGIPTSPKRNNPTDEIRVRVVEYLPLGRA